MKMRLNYPTYPGLTTHQGGHLPADNRAFALWTYYTYAQQLHERLGKSTDDQFGLLETDRWLDPHYAQIARSVALMYQFKDPGVFMEERFWKVIAKQAVSMELPDPTGRDYTRPLAVVIH